MRVVNGWRLFEHAAFKTQKARLETMVEARKQADPEGWRSSADAKLLKAIQHLTGTAIPANPLDEGYRHGGTLSGKRKHWFRAKFGNGRYRLFFQFSSAEKLIIYAWVNDEHTLRTYGAKTDAYKEFARRLGKGDPPDSWEELAKAVEAKPKRETKPSAKAKSAKRS